MTTLAPPARSPAPVHRAWLLLLALPAFVAVWGGWVGLGGLAGFGPVVLLPGIADHFSMNLAVTLPAGMEAYAVIGLRVWLSGSPRISPRTRAFAMYSTIGALTIGCLGQVAYHVLARPETGAPMPVTVFVACLPVAVLGVGAALFHMIGDDMRDADSHDASHASHGASHENGASLTPPPDPSPRGDSTEVEQLPTTHVPASVAPAAPAETDDSQASLTEAPADPRDSQVFDAASLIPQQRDQEPDATWTAAAEQDRDALIAAALDATNDDVPDAMTILARQGVKVSPATVYRRVQRRRDEREVSGRVVSLDRRHTGTAG